MHTLKRRCPEIITRSNAEAHGYTVIEGKTTTTLQPIEPASEWVRARRRLAAEGKLGQLSTKTLVEIKED